MAQYYQELEHTADWAIQVWGKTIEELFAHAAGAMFELQGADLRANTSLETQAQVQGVDLEALLVNWLNELLFLSEMNDALYTHFEVQIEPISTQPQRAGDAGYELRAGVQGIPGRGPLAHVKAVTYWDIAVEQVDERWQARVTFDT